MNRNACLCFVIGFFLLRPVGLIRRQDNNIRFYKDPGKVKVPVAKFCLRVYMFAICIETLETKALSLSPHQFGFNHPQRRFVVSVRYPPVPVCLAVSCPLQPAFGRLGSEAPYDQRVCGIPRSCPGLRLMAVTIKGKEALAIALWPPNVTR